MVIAGWRINFDALLARMVYRWSGRTLMVMLAACATVALLAGAVPPVWRGEAQLRLNGHPEARLEVDGKPWPHQLYAGTHVAVATLPDGRRSSVEFVVRRGETATITLPPGLAKPRVRALPPDGPESTVFRASFVDGTWRVQSRRSDDVDAAVQTVALRSGGLEPLSLLDAYGGRADTVTAGSRSYSALYRPAANGSAGALEVRGWQGGGTFAITGTLTFVRWAPDAHLLLAAERLRSDGEELRVFSPDAEPAPVLAVPGHVSDIVWHPAGDAAALLSRHRNRLTLTAIRFRPTFATRLLADLVVPGASADASGEPAAEPLAVVPLTWSGSAIEWLAPDERGLSILWRAPLETLLPERAGALEAAALHRTKEGALRIARAWHGRLAIGQQANGRFHVEAWLPDIPATRDLSGLWSPDGSSLLLRSGRSAWLVDVHGSTGGD